MKKIFFSSVIISSSILISCSSSNEEFNPNGMSEMAVLMEKMSADMTTARTHIQEGTKATMNAEDYKTIFTAITTKDNVINEQFRTYAESFIENVKAFSTAESTEQANIYKRITTSCINCHQDVCPGPIARIKKISLP